MVHLHRLIALLLLLVVNSAFALVQPRLQYTSSVGSTALQSSAAAACQIGVDFRNSQSAGSGYSYSFVGYTSSPGQNSGTCNVNRTGPYGVNVGLGSFTVFEVVQCPVNSVEVTGGCECKPEFIEYDNSQCRPKNPCPSGQHEEGGACVPDNCKPNEVRVAGFCVPEPPCPPGETRVNGVCKKDPCPKGKDMGTFDVPGPDSTVFFCDAGCTVKATSSICVSWEGKTQCTGTGYTTGSSCTGPSGGPNTGDGPSGGNTGNPGTSGPGTGGTGDPGTGGTTGGGTTGGGTTGGGTTGGGTSGGSSSSGLPSPVTTNPNPDGTCPSGTVISSDKKSCLQQPRPPNGDGTCPAGMVKVGSMCYPTEPVGGGGNGDGDGEGDKSNFGGQCSAGFACEGDAIQCAIASEQHRRACQLMENKSAESQLYDQEKGKEGKRTDDLPGNATHDLNGRISSADLLGGGSGLQDLTITVMGTSVTLPLSRINSYLSALGNVLLAVSFLMAVRIVGRG